MSAVATVAGSRTRDAARRCVLLLVFLAACVHPPAPAEVPPAPSPAPTGHRQEGHLAASAPADHLVVVDATEPDDALARWRRLTAPSVAQARATYPASKRRYLAGLPQGDSFFVTILLRDATGRFEQVFVLVDRIVGDTVTGRLASDIQGVEGHQSGETLQVPESEIVDWTISTADGHEEGNFVGKFLESTGGNGL